MEESEYGSDQYTYYKILQSTYKVLANSYYGILGERNSVFYNPHVQNSITMTGQDLITTAILTIENFLADNVKFEDFDDIVNFIFETLSENVDDQILKYVDEPVSKSDLARYLTSKTNKRLDDLSEKKLNDMISKLSSEDINRLFYKNRVVEFLKNSYVKERFSRLLSFKYDTEDPTKEMSKELKPFIKMITDFCFSNIIFEDRFKRVINMDRKNVVVSDTDSTFINLSSYIDATNKMFSLNTENKDQQLTLMNIYIDIVTEVLAKTFSKMTGNSGLLDQFKPIISMKNEFVFSRIMLTRNKKSYAGTITSELGKLLPKPVLDMKGLSIRKSSVAKTLKKQFTDILKEDVLNVKNINLAHIIKKFDQLGLEVEKSLKNGDLTYSLPKNIENIDGYKDASMQEPVRGTIVWNSIEPETPIVPPEKVNIVKMRAFDKTSPELEKLKLSNEPKYNSIIKTVFNEGVEKPTIDISRFGLSVVSIPKSVERIPEYLLPMIDFQSMVNNNMTNGYIILESLGIYTEEVKTTKYKSNIIEI
jgi:DNA polymerase elongation subunit (family B)